MYCGSSAGNNKEYTKAARALGDLMVDKNITLIYGGLASNDLHPCNFPSC